MPQATSTLARRGRRGCPPAPRGSPRRRGSSGRASCDPPSPEGGARATDRRGLLAPPLRFARRYGSPPGSPGSPARPRHARLGGRGCVVTRAGTAHQFSWASFWRTRPELVAHLLVIGRRVGEVGQVLLPVGDPALEPSHVAPGRAAVAPLPRRGGIEHEQPVDHPHHLVPGFAAPVDALEVGEHPGEELPVAHRREVLRGEPDRPAEGPADQLPAALGASAARRG